MKRTLLKLFSAILLLIALQLRYPPAYAMSDVPAQVVDARKSVVRVLSETRDGTMSGSGFAIGDGTPVSYIVTNHHVIENSTGDIRILRENNQEISAKVYLDVPHADLCVLSLSQPLYDAPALALVNQDIVDVGVAVYALGYPAAADYLSDKTTGDYEDVTITDGIVSAVKSLTLLESQPAVRILQINAAISSGNSGGPLVNRNGQVVGIDTFGVRDSQNINGAISVLELAAALEQKGIPYRAAASGPALSAYLLYVGAGVVAVVAAIFAWILLVKRFKRKKSPRQKLMADYMANWGGRLSFDMAVRVCTPAMHALEKIHADGHTHGNICPETLLVSIDTNQAVLGAPASVDKSAGVLLHPGYSAPEQYQSDGRIGPWSDVYSLCAVLFFMVTGTKPPDVLARQAGAESTQPAFGTAYIEEESARAILGGLALDPSQRPQNGSELLEALHLSVAHPLPVVLTKQVTTKPRSKRTQNKRRRMLVGVAALFLVGASVAGLYFFTDSRYAVAMDYIQRQDYPNAVQSLKWVIPFYKDASKAMNFAKAGNDMMNHQYEQAKTQFNVLGTFLDADTMASEVDYQNAIYLLNDGQYDQAKRMFSGLGSYKDAVQMVQQVDYQQATHLLNQKNYDKAKNVFASLGDYKNAKTMLLEVDYRNAIEWMEKDNYEKAIPLLEGITKKNYKDAQQLMQAANYEWGLSYYKEKRYIDAYKRMSAAAPYLDSQAYLQLLSESIYEEGIDLYRSGRYSSASERFTQIKNYGNAEAYLTMCDAHTKTQTDSLNDYSAMSSLHKKLKSYGSFEDAESLYNGDMFLLYRLEGTWFDTKNQMGLALRWSGNEWTIILADAKAKNPNTIPLSTLYVSIRNNTISIDDTITLSMLSTDKAVFAFGKYKFTLTRYR